MYSLVEKRSDGTTVVYISFWRYCVFGLLFAGAFYVFMWIIVKLYHERHADFWQHWSQTANLITGAFVGAIATPFFAYWMAKGLYKKVQLEINRSSLRYLSVGVRGGVLFSEIYRSISYHDITSIEMENHFLTNKVINIQTATEKHNIVLLLSESEKISCFEAIKDAVQAAGTRRSGAFIEP